MTVIHSCRANFIWKSFFVEKRLKLKSEGKESKLRKKIFGDFLLPQSERSDCPSNLLLCSSDSSRFMLA